MPRRREMLPPTKAPKVTAGLTWPPEMLAPTETATKRAKAWATEAATRPEGVLAPLWVSLLKAMPEPSPAKTNIRVEMNSARAALRASGWVASRGWPTAMFLIGMTEIKRWRLNLWGVITTSWRECTGLHFSTRSFYLYSKCVVFGRWLKPVSGCTINFYERNL